MMTKIFFFAFAITGSIAILCAIATSVSILITILDTLIRVLFGVETGIWDTPPDKYDYVELIFRPLGLTGITILITVVLLIVYSLFKYV